MLRLVMRRTLTSAWIETTAPGSIFMEARVALSRVRGLKLCMAIHEDGELTVALSRVRGLKPVVVHKVDGADCRTLTSAWIETPTVPNDQDLYFVALSRVRGLKPFYLFCLFRGNASHSHECVD